MSTALSPRRHERHPFGLAAVVGLHLLLALAMLTARLQVDAPPPLQAPLAQIELPAASPPPLPHTLPGAPRAIPRPLVAPVPEVVVDRTEAVREPQQDAPPVPAATAPPAAAPAPVSPLASGQGTAQGQGQGEGTSTGAGHPPRVYADAAQCQPQYPQIARLHNVAGTTRLRFSIDAAGRIVGVKLVRRSGPMPENYVMDYAAIEAFSRCPVEAGVDESGHAVGGSADIVYRWVLNTD